MAERIIDRFEAIQVNEQYGKPERLPCGAFNGDSHAISEECTVGKSGEGIVVREIQDALFRRLALGNIARKDNETRVEPGIDVLAGNRKLKPQLTLWEFQFQLLAR